MVWIKPLQPSLKAFPSTRLVRIRKRNISAALIDIGPRANIFRFGDSNAATPTLREVTWTVHENEAWAIVGDGEGKGVLFQTLLGHMRVAPPPAKGLFPLLSGSDPYAQISLVSFAHRRAPGGAFYDYTARYGAVRDEDRVTLRQSMFPESWVDAPNPFKDLDKDLDKPKLQEDKLPDRLSPADQALFDILIDAMHLRNLLDLPLIALSNGQTRRARIVKAVMKRPELLLLDEPLTGLDVPSRDTLLSLLNTLHRRHAPRLIMGVRTQDVIPEWVTHLCVVRGNRVLTGQREEVQNNIRIESKRNLSKGHTPPSPAPTPRPVTLPETAGLLVEMKDVSVKYGPRVVLDKVNWQVRQGERWHLQGMNGTGKTTLLSLITGDHPQSFTQAHLHLPCSPSVSPIATAQPRIQPRKRTPTAHLRALIGVVSPELFDAFPRRHPGMSVWEAVGTGFEGGFVPRGLQGVGNLEELGVHGDAADHVRAWRVKRCWEVIEGLGPATWGRRDGSSSAEFALRKFTDLSVGEQRVVLLMRALVGQPPVVLLDEVWSGMDHYMVTAARNYLRGEGISKEQAVVVVTHWEEEVPWSDADGVKRLKLSAIQNYS